MPNYWYLLVLVGSFVIGLGTLYGVQSTLPWWGYIIANLFAALFILFFGAQMGLTGFQFNQQPIIQMVAGYIHPGKPLGMSLPSSPCLAIMFSHLNSSNFEQQTCISPSLDSMVYSKVNGFVVTSKLLSLHICHQNRLSQHKCAVP